MLARDAAIRKIWEGEEGEKTKFRCWVDEVDILDGEGNMRSDIGSDKG